MRTQVGIVGAGPAGLVLSHLLALEGIESVVLELRDRAYVERRVRAGVLEQGTVDLLCETGVGERLKREGQVHRGINLQFEGERHRIDLAELTGGRTITVYGQQEVVKDLIKARLDAGGQVLFEAGAEAVLDADSPRPRVRFRRGGAAEELQCDFVAGCDGSHGVCRDAIPSGLLTRLHKDYGLAWLGILAHAPPATDELIYSNNPRGFALHSMRSPEISRLYLQVRPDEELDAWPDDLVWDELERRLAFPGWSLNRGPVLEKSITTMRSELVEPMQYGRLYLCGDAAHIVPATGAKGLNLAVADARLLAEAIVEWYRSGRTALLESYSARCLRRVWRVEHFSWWMTAMLHRFESHDEFERRLQLAQLRYVCSSRAAATSLAENYVGMA